jgi:iron complex outermembrane recepter protein
MLFAPLFVAVPSLWAQDPVPQSPGEPPPALDHLVVEAADETAKGYAAPATTTAALKSPVPLLETPQAVSVVGEALIEDREARDLEDVLANVAGVSVGGYY